MADRQDPELLRALDENVAAHTGAEFFPQLDDKAVAEVFGLRISGFVAWLMWRGLYLLRVPTFARKSRLFLEWNWAMFFPPDISHLGYRRTQRKSSAPVAQVAKAGG